MDEKHKRDGSEHKLVDAIHYRRDFGATDGRLRENTLKSEVFWTS